MQFFKVPLLPDLFSDGEEFVGVAADRGRKAVVRSGDPNAMEGCVIAEHILFGEARDTLPGYWVALAGEGRAPDQAEADIEALAFGEIYKDVEGAGDSLTIASKVASPALLDPAAPGGVVPEADERGVARVTLVELEGAFVGAVLK